MDIPPFDLALEQFRDFLNRNGASDGIEWVFRDDLCPLSRGRFLVRRSDSSENRRLAQKVFSEGRSRGLLEISVIASSPQFTVATVWYPRTDRDQVQGWNRGMKLSILQPLPHAEFVSCLVWPVVRWLPTYRRYQSNAAFVGTREWAVA